MSAEILRRAASLMRERAEAATPGPWRQATAEVAADTVIFAESGPWLTNVENCPKTGAHQRVPGGSICTDQAVPNGDHIASWHPAVALAVADWLEVTASDVGTSSLAFHVALDAARAYLGEDA